VREACATLAIAVSGEHALAFAGGGERCDGETGHRVRRRADDYDQRHVDG